MDFEKRHLKDLDWIIILILCGLGVFSYLGISGSAQTDLAGKQLLWYLFGFIVLTVCLLFDYRLYHGLTYILYGIGIILIIGVLFTTERNGATSWYKLGPILFQPSELMKVFTILAGARYLAKREEKGERFDKFHQLIPFFVMVGVPMLLIFIQPDLGTAMVFMGITVVMLIVGGMRIRHIVYMGSVVGAFLGIMTYLYNFNDKLFFKLIKPYQWRRIEYWFNPDLDAMGFGFQLKQSLIAIGSGQLLGKGVHSASQASYGWVPVGESDFIFTVIGEKLGFIGAAILMMLFFILIYRMIRIAMDVKDPFGSYFVSGVVAVFTFQIFENIGMTIQLMPITGLTLPFISYGGSSLITNFLLVGIVLNIGMRKQQLRFD
ncbi:rod shape-determining protein RodA [Brevibacillus ginsengisoli]|uniref:rod shape-determining protein RodA n=1 Tax=Brevibacillus ginsengisoli TaxID=363854 RepID=UPI003CFB5934